MRCLLEGVIDFCFVVVFDFVFLEVFFDFFVVVVYVVGDVCVDFVEGVFEVIYCYVDVVDVFVDFFFLDVLDEFVGGVY